MNAEAKSNVQADILEEPAGETYERLLAVLGPACSHFSLVYWNPLRGAQAEYWDRMSSWLISHEEVSSWPGTAIWPRSGKALPILARYRLDDSSRLELAAAPGLYAWHEPDRPVDLALYSLAGEVRLASVAHERLARLTMPGPELGELVASTGLRVREVPPDGSGQEVPAQA